MVMTEVKVTYAVVLRGELMAVHAVAQGLEMLLDKHPDVKVVHHQTSASKLWIKEGEDVNGNDKV